MDKIFHSTFDFFTHALPGLCVVLGLYILSPEITSFDSLIEKSNQLKIGSGVFLLVVSYIIGFAINPIGNYLVKKYGLTYKMGSIIHKSNSETSELYVLIREYSQINFKYVETWNMYSAMSHNLMMASLIFTICTVYKISTQDVTNKSFWIILSLIALLAAVIFFFRSVKFWVWAANDLNAAVFKLKMKQRAANSDIIQAIPQNPGNPTT